MAEVGDIYPGTNERIVGVVYPPGGGRLLQGEFGGVFAEGGAQFAGSYFDLDPTHRNDPNRRFTGIELLEGGGYRSITANPNEAGYSFRPAPQPPPPTAAATPPPPTPQQQRQNFATTPEGMSAKGTLAATLAQYGLPTTLADTLWTNWYVNEGRPLQQILIDVEETPEFKQRFPGIAALKERRNRGEAVQIPSVGEYVALETGITSVMRDAGLPPGAFDEPSELAAFIGGSVSPKEVEDRIAAARNLLYSAPVETRQELSRLYDLDEGEAIAYILNPEKGMREVQRRVLAGGIGGASRRSGFGLLTAAEAEQLAESGITEAAAGQRSGELVPLAGLFEETAGEATTGDDLGRAEQIGYIGGSATAATQIETRRRRRTAQFQGGGGAATGGNGQTGLG